MGFVRLDDVTFDGGEIDAAFKRWREAIEQANNWSVDGHADFDAGPTGYALRVKGTTVVKVAKNGASAIAAASTALTPGSGTVTLYDFNGTAFVSTGVAVTAFNLHPTETVTANAMLKIIRIDGAWFVFWEPC